MKEERTLKRPIIVNARFLTQNITGVQRFAMEVSREMLKLNKEIEFIAPYPKSKIESQIVNDFNVKFLGPFKGHLWEQITLPNYIRGKNAILISLCNTAPMLIKKQVVTIHDIAFKRFPQWFSKPFALVYNIMIPWIAKNSYQIITVSQFSKSEITSVYGIDENKITVVHNCLPTSFDFKVNHLDGATEEIFRRKYILSVSSMNPRKNFKGLVKAFNLINDPDLHLYIVGNKGKNFNNKDYEINAYEKRVHFFENISDKKLALFYNNATLFAFPSFYEGFGIPLLEAAHFGLPICASDIPVFREVGIINVNYFDPYDVYDIKEKLILGLKGEKTKLDFSKYSWESGAKKILRLVN